MSQKTWQGDVGVATAVLHYSRAGMVVSVPTTEHSKYDLVVDTGTRLKRVQVKTCTFRAKSGAYEVQLRTNGANYSSKVNCTKISPECIDEVFILAGDGWAYEVPSEILDGRSTVTMSGKMLQFRVGQYPPLAGVV